MNIDTIRREITRFFAGVRQPIRALQTGLAIALRIQRANAEGLAGEKLQEMELLQHFGFTSAPPDGSQLILIPLGGRSSASVVVATEHGALRFKLDNQGESAVYNEWGDYIHLRKDRKMQVVSEAEVNVTTPLATFSGDVNVEGTVTVGVDVIAAGISLVHHTHGGIQRGGAHTDPPS